jgi:hypothetical protein
MEHNSESTYPFSSKTLSLGSKLFRLPFTRILYSFLIKKNMWSEGKYSKETKAAVQGTKTGV